MDVYFYNITKRLNSTAAAPTPAATLDCYLKNDCSFLNPYLRLNSSTKPTYNYFKLDDRYYWVTEVTSIANELWEIRGSVDPLTTFRGHIFNTSAFVLYDSTPNTQLPDSRLAIETDCDTHTSTADMPWYYTTGTQGTYFIATVGEKDNIKLEINSVDDLVIDGTLQQDFRSPTGVYTIPYSSLEEIGFDIDDFLRQLLRINVDMAQAIRDSIAAILPSTIPPVTDYTGFVQWLMELAKREFNAAAELTINYPTRMALLIAQNIIGGGNALQNVRASYWLPFTVPDTALTNALVADTLALGTYTDIVHGIKRVKDPIITAVDIPVSIPWQFNDWRDVSCTEIMLYIPLIGCINIPPECVKGNDNLYLRFALNLYSGEIAVEVRCNGGQLGTYGANCAMNILIGDSNVNMGGAVNTVVAGVTKNYAALAGGVADTLSGMSTSVGGIGGGAGTGLTNQIVCVVRTHNTSQEPSVLLPIIGTPTRQLKTLSQGLGYCQTLNAQVNCAAITGEPYPTQTEIDMINNYLNSGVYLE
jgi:hypothetical protein